MSCIPDITRTMEMLALYEGGMSLSQVASRFGVSRQTVFKRFERRAIQMRTQQEGPHIFWSGRKYSLRQNGYYALTTGRRNYLHRDVWRTANGKIPEGMDVHHCDENKYNNALGNLELFTKSDHGKKHGFGGNQYTGPFGRRPVRA